MHEGVFTQQIVDSIIEQLKQCPSRKPKAVRVKVGEVFHLVAEAVLMHYELATQGTVLEGVNLDLVEEPVKVLCAQCAKEGPVQDHHLLLCSFCHSRDVKPIAGQQITVEAFELEPL